MGNILLSSRILPIEITTGGKQLKCWDFPCPLVLLAFVPPVDARGEFVELNRCRLRVILSSLRQRVLVVPDLFCWSRSVEEHYVRRNASVGREYAVWQPDDRMEVELL